MTGPESARFGPCQEAGVVSPVALAARGPIPSVERGPGNGAVGLIQGEPYLPLETGWLAGTAPIQGLAVSL